MRLSYLMSRLFGGLLVLVCFQVAGVLAGEDCRSAPGSTHCVLQEGERLVEARHYEDAYLLIERALMLNPADMALRAGLARVMAEMGSLDAARALYPSSVQAQDLGGVRQQLDLVLGWSDNRRLQPRLDVLKLTLPDIGNVELKLATPLKPRPGPMLWLGWSAEYADGTQLNTRIVSSPDGNYGNLWARVLLPLKRSSGWWLNAEAYKRLNGESLLALALVHQWSLSWEWQLETQVGFRRDVSLDAIHGEGVLAFSRNTPIGQFGLQVQRSQTISGDVPGGGQWRYALAYALAGKVNQTHLQLAYQHRQSHDDETYHPWFDHGKPRHQTSNSINLRAEYPLSSSLRYWASFNHERLRSNIALYHYDRSEIWMGFRHQW